MSSLKRNNIKIKGNRKSHHCLYHHTLWRQYLALNHSLLALCVHIERTASFWAAPVTVYLGGFIILQCYLAYATFFIKAETPILVRLFFGYGLMIIAVLQYGLLLACSRVAKASGRLERVNREFYHSAFLIIDKRRGRGPDKNWLAHCFSILKAERLQAAGRLRPYAIHLLDSYRVTAKTFYLVTLVAE